MTPARREPVTALMIVTASMLSEAATPPAIGEVIEGLDPDRFVPAVLAEADVPQAVLDPWRLDGVAVMVQRRVGGSNSVLGGGRRLFELVHWLRTSDARVVYVWASDPSIVRLVQRARRFAGGVQDVIEIGPSSFVPDGPR